jgi:hypothetical protein
MLVNDCKHLARLERFEARPTQILVRPVALVLTFREDASLHLDLELRGLPFLDGVELIETLDKQKLSDLLDHRERVRDAARPEIIPNTINLRAYFAC